ncbi:hypothetical protein QQ045_011980 [Rhodiola kirilowii]
MGKKVVIIGVSSVLLLVAMVVPVCVAHKGGIKSAQSAICKATGHKHSCDTLASAKMTAQPNKELIKLAIKAAMDYIPVATKNKKALEKKYKDSPRTYGALQYCDEAFDNAKFDLQETLNKLNALDWSKVGESAMDIQTAISGSYTSFTMCIDSFEDESASTIQAKKEMEKVVQPAKELTDKVLVLVNKIKRS